MAPPTTRAKRICKRHSSLHLRRNQSPHSTICPTSAIRHPQNPSGADRNPIARSPRPSQTPATYFKRPYRNCPGQETCAQSRLIGRGSPDRDLSFLVLNSQASVQVTHPVWLQALQRRRGSIWNGRPNSAALALRVHQLLVRVPLGRREVSTQFLRCAPRAVAGGVPLDTPPLFERPRSTVSKPN